MLFLFRSLPSAITKLLCDVRDALRHVGVDADSTVTQACGNHGLAAAETHKAHVLMLPCQLLKGESDDHRRIKAHTQLQQNGSLLFTRRKKLFEAVLRGVPVFGRLQLFFSILCWCLKLPLYIICL